MWTVTLCLSNMSSGFRLFHSMWAVLVKLNAVKMTALKLWCLDCIIITRVYRSYPLKSLCRDLLHPVHVEASGNVSGCLAGDLHWWRWSFYHLDPDCISCTCECAPVDRDRSGWTSLTGPIPFLIQGLRPLPVATKSRKRIHLLQCMLGLCSHDDYMEGLLVL